MSLISKFFAGNERVARVASGSQTLAMGSSDKRAVSLVQLALAALGHPMPGSTKPLGMDGIFGAETHKAVVGFQRKNRLVQDGVVGKETIKCLDGQVKEALPAGAPPDFGVLGLPRSYFIPRPVAQLRQPSEGSCWATTGTILARWNDQKIQDYIVKTHSDYSRKGVTDQVRFVTAHADQNSASGEYFQKRFEEDKGLLPGRNEQFFVKGLGRQRFRPPPSPFSLAPMEWGGSLAWMALLCSVKRPVAVHVLSYRLGWCHWITVTGVDLAGTMPNRFAPKKDGPVIPFLTTGIIHYFDSATGRQAIASAEDMDYLVGRLPDFASGADQYRARMFY